MKGSPTVPFAAIRPLQSLDLLSQREMASLATSDQEVYSLFRRCALAVINAGGDSDDGREILDRYRDFEVHVVPEYRGLKLELENAPAQAFVDGKMITGIRAHLFSALRDIVYIHQIQVRQQQFDLQSGAGITDAVFRILRNANIVKTNEKPRLIVCWGGHSISREEYEFTKQVGYELGLRELDIVTGCGPGAMKGPMKGATIGHAKQFSRRRRYIGISEPGIIASESPNPIVNELVIMPDIEKRLEAFVRLAHGVVVFPGGVGTAEEILYLLAIKMHPANADIVLPLIFAAPACSADYFEHIDDFLRATLGDGVSEHYRVVIGDAAEVARRLSRELKLLRRQRIRRQESFSFNWGLHIEPGLQQPFAVSHASMAALPLHREQGVHDLAAVLRQAFCGIVTGNVKDYGIRAIAEHGPYQLQGEEWLLGRLGELLQRFVADGRMKLDRDSYVPSFQLLGR